MPTHPGVPEQFLMQSAKLSLKTRKYLAELSSAVAPRQARLWPSIAEKTSELLVVPVVLSIGVVVTGATEVVVVVAAVMVVGFIVVEAMLGVVS